MLEGKVASMTDQLGNQVDLQRTAEIRAQKVEGTLYSMEDKLRRAEGELAAGDMLRDGLRMDKERVGVVSSMKSGFWIKLSRLYIEKSGIKINKPFFLEKSLLYLLC